MSILIPSGLRMTVPEPLSAVLSWRRTAARKKRSLRAGAAVGKNN